MSRFVFVMLVVSSLARAEGLVAAVLDAPNVADPTVKRLQRTTESVLKQLTSLPVSEGPAFKRGAPKKCGDDCALSLVKTLDATGVVVLDLKGLEGKGERISLELSLWLDGQKVASRRGEGTADGFEAAVRPVLEGVLPGWARKGFGGMRVSVEPGSVVKVDGRVASGKVGELVAVTAGTHQLDVVFADGHAVLQRVEVAEGARLPVEVQSTSDAFDVGRSAKQGSGALRVVSYSVWMAGAAALAGGLVAGALGRGTAAGLSPCTGQIRDCATLDTVLEKNRQAAALSSTGNVLIGVGAGLAVVGAGLFVVDVATK